MANFTNWYFPTAKRRDAWARLTTPFVARSYGGRLIDPFLQLTLRLFGGQRDRRDWPSVVTVRDR